MISVPTEPPSSEKPGPISGRLFYSRTVTQTIVAHHPRITEPPHLGKPPGRRLARTIDPVQMR